MSEWTALNMRSFPRAPEQIREPEDWAEYSDEHDARPDFDLAFQVDFAVGERFMGCSCFTPQELQDLFTEHCVGAAGDQVTDESAYPPLLLMSVMSRGSQTYSHNHSARLLVYSLFKFVISLNL